MKRAIFGAGANGRLFLKGMKLSGITVDAFIDQMGSHSEIDGVPVLKPDAIAEKSEWQLFCAVFPQALVKPSNRALKSSEEQLRQLGFFHVESFSETLHSFPAIMKGYFESHHLWMHSDPEVMVNREAIDRLRPLLSDELSVQLLEQWIAWRSSQSMGHYIEPDGQCEYFPQNIPQLFPQQPLHFIDCGAYIGDTVEDLYQLWSGKIESVTCFEPDFYNLQQLHQILARLQYSTQQGYCHIYPCGVGLETEILSFSGGQGSSSAMVISQKSGEGKALVSVVSLDQTMSLSQPNYIKMDIEGAELKALQGAKELIATQAPSLAICLYHKPEDLWEVPLYLHQIQPEYKMYIRTHDHLGLSTVLYCCT
jgi:FkbM family methyltransferase